MRFKRVAAKLAAAVLLTFSLLLTGCDEPDEFTGNTGELSLEPGDVYAVFTIKDYGDITVKLFPEACPVAVEHFTTLAKRGYYDGRTIHRVVEDYIIQGGSLNGDGTDGSIEEDEYFPIETNAMLRNFYGALCFASSNNGNYNQFYFVSNGVPYDVEQIVADINATLNDEEQAAKLEEKQISYYTNYAKALSELPDAVKIRYAEVGGNYMLDGNSTVFGQTIEGYDVLDAVDSVPVVSGNAIDDRNEIDSKPAETITIEKVEVVEIPLPVETEETTAAAKKRRTTATTTEAPAPAETSPAETETPVSEGSDNTETAQISDTSDTSDTSETSETSEISETAAAEPSESAASSETEPAGAA